MQTTIFEARPKASGSAEKDTSSYNPYLAARREWDERYGDQITRARSWRTMALLCALLGLVLAGGLIWQSSRTRVVPFVAVIDSFGRPIVSGLADQTTTADERLKKSTVLEWVENLRTVTTDGIAQRKLIDRVYSHIANNSPAMTFVSDFYRANQPFERAQSETVGVDVRSVLPTSDRTFEVDWVETSRDLYGNVKNADRWKGTFTIATNTPTDERIARVNPLGLYVVSANWSRVLQ
ncbi:MAG: conjugal transfer protein TrbF [Bryobacteraceae bacterium]